MKCKKWLWFAMWDVASCPIWQGNCYRIGVAFLRQIMASNPYFPLAVLFVAALGFGLAPLGLAWLWARVFSPAKPNAVKNAIYECGLESRGDAWVQFRSAYYLYAIIFLVFDVEAIFLLPFAVAFTGLGVGACVSMLVFVLLLAEGLAWAWAKGVLTWA
jgi:NADH-quinone oxidoreductase subunit A